MPLIISENTNLWSIDADAYAQGCNMKGKMGHGIAVQFKQRYPQMYKEYVKHCDELTAPLTPGGFFFWPAEHNVAAVYNLFTQVYPGKDGRLEACRDAFNGMLNHAVQHSIATIAMPAIGCGLAGLRWKDVKFILNECIEKSGFPGDVIVAFQFEEFDKTPRTIRRTP